MVRVLLVDDHDDVRVTLTRALKRLGHEVAQASNGAEALRALRDTPCDLVITDINMPEMDGIELVLAIRSERADLPVIAMSGGGMLAKELLLADADALGAVLTLEKPISVADLASAVDHAMAAPPRGDP